MCIVVFVNAPSDVEVEVPRHPVEQGHASMVASTQWRPERRSLRFRVRIRYTSFLLIGGLANWTSKALASRAVTGNAVDSLALSTKHKVPILETVITYL